MDPTIGWFISIASLSSLAWAGGYYLGKRSAVSARATLMGGLACMGTWVWLSYHPAVAVRLIPLPVLTIIEGVGSVPFFMLLLGLAWSRAKIARQKRLITWAMMFGAVFFVNGGLWMLQSTPEMGFAGTVSDEQVMQSQDYSCVPAACAQALDILGVASSEKQMAKLTQTRPGTGSTTLRAMLGLNQRLERTPYRVELLEVKAAEIRHLPLPIVTPLRYEKTRRHMVTIISATDDTIRILDPIDGEVLLSWDSLETVFAGEVLVFTQR
jgi:predicted double-glycine peptidase